MTGKQSEGMLAYELQLYAEFSMRHKNEIEQHKETVNYLDQKVTEKRDELLVAAKDKKVLESYKEKQAVIHRQQIAEKERQFLDEIAVQNSGKDKR